MALNLRNVILFLLMLVAAVASIVMRPTHRFADRGPKVELEKIIPRNFGDWAEDKQGIAQIVDPQQKEMLDVIYAETLSRTYVNARGDRIMLSIAYGQDQSRDLQIHRPEVCYSAQGFQIISTEKQVLNIGAEEIPVMRIVAKQGGREESITYWVRFGNKIVRGNVEQGIARLGYGISGYIADGVLFRVSSISANPSVAFDIQREFVNQLLSSIDADTKIYLMGDRFAASAK